MKVFKTVVLIVGVFATTALSDGPYYTIRIFPGGSCANYTCGTNAKCSVINGNPVCTCPNFHTGDPRTSCYKVECLTNEDCPANRVCSPSNSCVDPCNGLCGLNARCEVNHHIINCVCQHGYTGDPFTNCHVNPQPPCKPSPCGANTKYEVINEVPTCSCLPGYYGSPLSGCRHECENDCDCSSHLACSSNFRCESPCNKCGEGANCDVVNHQPNCTCPNNWLGHPNSRCYPECTHHSDCPDSKPACLSGKCVNPCTGACGVNANCKLRGKMTPLCSCPKNMTGDPSVSCEPKPPCEPSPCGANTKCEVINKVATCSCLPGYYGPPLSGCRHECENDCDCSSHLACSSTFRCESPCNKCGEGANCDVVNHQPNCTCPNNWLGHPNSRCYPECTHHSDCPDSKPACLSGKCVNPCTGVCGVNANCKLRGKMTPLCSCPKNMTGDPSVSCEPKPPCEPSPCGANTKCEVINKVATCSCLPGYYGPPLSGCRHECENDYDCSSHLACSSTFRCESPCNKCGEGANCDVVNHQPNCTCPNNWLGHPNSRCYPECTHHSDCPDSKPACLSGKCVNPCTGVCGVNANCKLRGKMTPLCSCPKNMTGDPSVSCKPKPPCEPSPCGANTKCEVINKVATCSCLPGYYGSPLSDCRHECENDCDCSSHLACSSTFRCESPCNKCGEGANCDVVNHQPNCTCPNNWLGDPLSRCHPECTHHSDCPDSKPACRSGKCENPCTGACGVNANCKLRGKMTPLCSCPKNMTGDPSVSCEPKPPCEPSPCGANTKCEVINKVATCSCLPGYYGSPLSGCRHECENDYDCSSHLACSSTFRCESSCNKCGEGANCDVVNHQPNCTCPNNWLGDPYSRCYPECTHHSDCPGSKPACLYQKCVNPCTGACGCNANCKLRGIIPVCSCPKNMTGDPSVSCKPKPPCEPSPCGANTKCEVINKVATCSCLPGYYGSPLSGCRHECENDCDCSSHLACSSTFRCESPCNKCGEGANCDVVNHQPNCTCPNNWLGDPLSRCHPECTHHSDCPDSKPACRSGKCENPCTGACGVNANCKLRGKMTPLCSCPKNMTGDPSVSCKPKPPCEPSPCGANTKCEVINKVATCSCLPGYYGSPLSGCRHECEDDCDCSSHLACSSTFRCESPCNKCGEGANCDVVNHQPNCTCPNNWLGDPLSRCYPECTRHSDCSGSKPACLYQKCVNPCAGACGCNANCKLRGITPVCSCPKNMTGDPSVSCEPIDLCRPSPCGENAICTPGHGNTGKERPVCTCPAGYIGNALILCKPGECQVDSDCPDNRACIDYFCQHLCTGK